jgi:hypothetical protein
LANRMYEFTFTIVDGVPKIDRREDLSHDLNEQAQAMTQAFESVCFWIFDPDWKNLIFDVLSHVCVGSECSWISDPGWNIFIR